jgi:hypothetical protein
MPSWLRQYFLVCAGQIQVGLVGLDMVLLVMGRELVSFKIVDATLSTNIGRAAVVDSPGAPRDTTHDSDVTIALTVEDMSLRDMQVGGDSSLQIRRLLCTNPNSVVSVRLAV